LGNAAQDRGGQIVDHDAIVGLLVFFIGTHNTFVVDRMVRKSYNPAPVAWART